MRNLDARTTVAAVISVVHATAWLIVAAIVSTIMPIQGIDALVFALTQVGWLVTAALLLGWRHARLFAIAYCLYPLALGAWATWVGITRIGGYAQIEWGLTAVMVVAPLLIIGLVLSARSSRTR